MKFSKHHPPVQQTLLAQSVSLDPDAILVRTFREQGVSPIFQTELKTVEAEQRALYPGFYIRCANGVNRWIGATMTDAQQYIDRSAAEIQQMTHGMYYEIEYSFGHNAGGASPWANLHWTFTRTSQLPAHQAN